MLTLHHRTTHLVLLGEVEADDGLLGVRHLPDLLHGGGRGGAGGGAQRQALARVDPGHGAGAAHCTRRTVISTFYNCS